jgi:hypothetical protein
MEKRNRRQGLVAPSPDNFDQSYNRAKNLLRLIAF